MVDEVQTEHVRVVVLLQRLEQDVAGVAVVVSDQRIQRQGAPERLVVVRELDQPSRPVGRRSLPCRVHSVGGRVAEPDCRHRNPDLLAQKRAEQFGSPPLRAQTFADPKFAVGEVQTWTTRPMELNGRLYRFHRRQAGEEFDPPLSAAVLGHWTLKYRMDVGPYSRRVVPVVVPVQIRKSRDEAFRRNEV